MTRNDLLFIGGFGIFVAAAVLYAYVTQRTMWSIPTFVLGLCGLALCLVMYTEEKHGRLSSEGIVKVLLYSIGVNIAGSLLFAAGSMILRSMR